MKLSILCFIISLTIFVNIASADGYQVFCHSDNTNTYIPIKTFKTLKEAEEFVEDEDRSCYIESYEEWRKK